MAKRGKPRTPRAIPFKEAIVLIPLTFNDQTAVPQDTIQAFLEELFLAFHGWTIEGAVKGAYRMQSGDRRVEDHLKVSVILHEPQVPDLEAMIARWARALGQETMLLKVADSTVKFIPPEPEADEP